MSDCSTSLLPEECCHSTDDQRAANRFTEGPQMSVSKVCSWHLFSFSREQESICALQGRCQATVVLWQGGARDASHCKDFTESSYFQPMCQALPHYLPLSLVTLRPKFIQLNLFREQISIFLLESMGKGWEQKEYKLLTVQWGKEHNLQSTDRL